MRKQNKKTDRVFELVLSNGRHYTFDSGYEMWKQMTMQRNRWQFFDGNDNDVVDYSTWVKNRNSKKNKKK